MKLNKLLIGALLAMGSALGASTQVLAVSDAVYQCCLARQELCEDAYGPARCQGVFERCMQGRSCNTNDF